MPRAYCFIREQPAYRREAFVAGLAAAGFKVSCQDYHRPFVPWGTVGRGDVAVVWNRYGTVEQLADRFEAHGARVIVAENGYLGADDAGTQHYALALSGHNGSGRWPVDDGTRWRALGIELKPWRDDGDHILVCPNRSFGPRGFAMPRGWAESAALRLRAITKREVRIRPHPGNWQKEPPKIPLAEDLTGCWCVVIWSSSAGVHALVAGIPVIREAPWWVLHGADYRRLADVDHLPLPDEATRRLAFERLASAQWTVAEIATGEPFRRLMAL